MRGFEIYHFERGDDSVCSTRRYLSGADAVEMRISYAALENQQGNLVRAEVRLPASLRTRGSRLPATWLS